MIYIILYSVITPGTPTGTTGSLYYGFAHDLANAEKMFEGLTLSNDCIRKEIWMDDGKGYRRLVKHEQYHS